MSSEISLSTHWGQVMHIGVCKVAIIGSDNGLSPGWRQAIIWVNGGLLLIGPLGTIFSEILIKIYKFSFKKMHLKMSGKRRPFWLSHSVFKLLSHLPGTNESTLFLWMLIMMTLHPPPTIKWAGQSWTHFWWKFDTTSNTCVCFLFTLSGPRADHISNHISYPHILSSLKGTQNS